MHIRVDDLTGPEIAAFLEEHIQEMRSISPPESKHALDLAGLRTPDITFWTLWDHDPATASGGTLLACGALKRLSADHAEIKSMRTAAAARGRGIASALLTHIIAHARAAGFRRLSLETGSQPFFAPARALYTRFGFTPCPPFADYQPDPNSTFMTLTL